VLVFVEIVFINMLLSGDNAVVIALASQQLPPKQRKKAVWWGAAAAVALRCLLTLIALTLLEVPYLQAVGAVLLFMIAVKLVKDAASHRSEDAQSVGRVSSLAGAVRTIVAADFIMSLDNVLAIAAVAEGEPVLILLGIAISIPMIIWGSQMLSSLLHRFPTLVYLGGGLLGYAAGEMLMNDPALEKVGFSGMSTLHQAVPILFIPLVIIIALLRLRR
jgi:YjbE family integral membrane protein